jgi:hypothetical protein
MVEVSSEVALAAEYALVLYMFDAPIGLRVGEIQ